MSKVKKVILCCLSIPLIILSMCPTFAYAVDDDLIFDMPCSFPVSDSHHFSFEVLYRHKETGTFVAHTFSFNISGIILTDAEGITSNYYPLDYFTPVLEYKDNTLTFYFDDTSGVTSPAFSFVYADISSLGTVNYSRKVGGTSTAILLKSDSSFEFVGVNPGNVFFYVFNGSLNSVPFSCVYDNSSNYTSLLLDIISDLTLLHEDNVDQVDKLVEIINGVVQLHSDNLEILEEFATLLSDTAYIKDVLDLICNYLYDDLNFMLWELDFQLMDINTRLDTIIEILRSSGESNLTSPDSSNVDDYYEIEQGLINRTDVDVSNVVNVQIDQNAMSFTWNLLDTIMNSNGKVFGMTLTVLSLGIIALILGR